VTFCICLVLFFSLFRGSHTWLEQHHHLPRHAFPPFGVFVPASLNPPSLFHAVRFWLLSLVAFILQSVSAAKVYVRTLPLLSLLPPLYSRRQENLVQVFRLREVKPTLIMANPLMGPHIPCSLSSLLVSIKSPALIWFLRYF